MNKINFINSIQANKNDKDIEDAVLQFADGFKNGEIDKNEFASILEVLVSHKKNNVLNNILLSFKKNNYSINDMLPALFNDALERDEQDCQKIILDSILDEALTTKNIDFIENRIFDNEEVMDLLVKSNQVQLLDSIFKTYQQITGTSAPPSYTPNIFACQSIEMVELFKKYGIKSKELYSTAIKNQNDDTLAQLLTSESIVSALREDSEKRKLVLETLLSENKVKSLAALLNDDKQNEFKQEILYLIYSKPLLIRSSQVYNLLQDKLNLFNENIFLIQYLYAINGIAQYDVDKHEATLRLLEEKLIYTGNELVGSFPTDSFQPSESLRKLGLLAIKMNLPKMTNLLFTRNIYYIQPSILNMDETTIDDAIEICIKNNNKNCYNYLVNVLPPYHRSLFKLLQKYLSVGLDSEYLNTLIDRRGLEFINIEPSRNAILNTDSPLIAKKFIELNLLQYPSEAITRLAQIAEQQGDSETSRFLQNKKIEISIKKTNEHEKLDTNLEESIKKNYGMNISQTQYEEYSKQIAGLICHAIANNQFSLTPQNNLLDLVRLGKMRNHIAELSGTSKASDFGKPRYGAGEITTPHTGRYKSYFTEFLVNIVPTYQDSPYLHIKDYVIKNGEVGINATVTGKIGDQEIPLTSYDVREQTMYESETPSVWVHTNPKYIPLILKHVTNLINEVCKNPIDLQNQKEIDQLTYQIAKIHWWLAQATPFERGSAAITEWIIMGIFQYHGLSIDWKKQMPDCWALIIPHEEGYAKRYTEFSEINIIPKQVKQAGNFGLFSPSQTVSESPEKKENPSPRGSG